MLLPCQERLVRVCRRLKQIRCLCHRVPGLQTSYFPYQTEYFRKKRKNLKCNNCLFQVCTKNFFQVHNKNMFESCLDRLSPWLSQSADRKPKGGLPSSKTCWTGYHLPVSTGNIEQNPCNAIMTQAHLYECAFCTQITSICQQIVNLIGDCYDDI